MINPNPIEKFVRNWDAAPVGLHRWVIAGGILELLDLLVVRHSDAQSRVSIAILLLYFLFDKGRIARWLTVIFCLFFAVLVSAVALLKSGYPGVYLEAPISFYYLGLAGYLVFSPKYKDWLKSTELTSSSTN